MASTATVAEPRAWLLLLFSHHLLSVALRLVCIPCLDAVSPDDVSTLLALGGGKRRRDAPSTTEAWSGSGAEGIDIADREGKILPVERDGSRPEKPSYPIVGDTSRRGPKQPKQRR